MERVHHIPLKLIPHAHVSNKTNDSCAECGLYFTHPIHRKGMTKLEYYDVVVNDRRQAVYLKGDVDELIDALIERLDAAIDNKTCLIDTKSGVRMRVVGQDLWDNNEKLEEAVQEGDQRFSDLQDEHMQLEAVNAELRRILGPALLTVIKVKELGDALKVKYKKENKNV